MAKYTGYTPSFILYSSSFNLAPQTRGGGGVGGEWGLGVRSRPDKISCCLAANHLPLQFWPREKQESQWRLTCRTRGTMAANGGQQQVCTRTNLAKTAAAPGGTQSIAADTRQSHVWKHITCKICLHINPQLQKNVSGNTRHVKGHATYITGVMGISRLSFSFLLSLTLSIASLPHSLHSPFLHSNHVWLHHCSLQLCRLLCFTSVTCSCQCSKRTYPEYKVSNLLLFCYRTQTLIFASEPWEFLRNQWLWVYVDNSQCTWSVNVCLSQVDTCLGTKTCVCHR